MDSTVMYFAIGFVAIAIAVYFAKSKGKPVADEWQRAFDLAKELVPAVEQLALTEQIAKTQKLDHVMNELRLHYPSLTEKQLRWAVESAVHWMKNSQLAEVVNDYTVNLAPLEQRLQSMNGAN